MPNPSLIERETEAIVQRLKADAVSEGDGPVDPNLGRLSCALRGMRGVDQQQIAKVGVEIVSMLMQKNNDYGNTAFTPPMLAPELSADAGIRVRLSDKIARIQNLLKSNKPEVAESLEDSIRDAIGYMILWLVQRNRDSHDD
jgi:hypothetical protein